jgi:multiple sugar transport system ATP-binding protein
LGIRPEDLRVSAVQHDGWLPASVYVIELMGSETFVFLTLGRERIIARAPADFRAEVESNVWLEMETAKAHFFHPTSGEKLG